MAIKWLDFCNEQGFSYGENVTSKDFTARDIIIEKLNSKPELIRNRYKAIKYNGHPFNNCMILVTDSIPDITEDELIALYKSGKIFSQNKNIDGIPENKQAFSFFDLDKEGYPSWFGDNLVNEVYKELEDNE